MPRHTLCICALRNKLQSHGLERYLTRHLYHLCKFTFVDSRLYRVKARSSHSCQPVAPLLVQITEVVDSARHYLYRLAILEVLVVRVVDHEGP